MGISFIGALLLLKSHIYIPSIFSLPVAVIHGIYHSCSNKFYLNLIKVLKYKGLNYAVCLKSGEGSESLFYPLKNNVKKPVKK